MRELTITYTLLNKTHARIVDAIIVLHCFLSSTKFSLCFQLLFTEDYARMRMRAGPLVAVPWRARRHQLLAYVGRAGACVAAATAARAGDV